MVRKVSLTGTLHLHLLAVQFIILGLIFEIRTPTKSIMGFGLAVLGLLMGAVALLAASTTPRTEPRQSAE
ncbi:hypothetical protein [Halorhabdus rudnickae]|uniref:hypothetical protein n=1 Tax=Halorhabdus rudnickae TaxID=1775544 RepID=UPI001083DA30|nr:hypothetical protein [Halorhabdus rudnickae]